MQAPVVTRTAAAACCLSLSGELPQTAMPSNQLHWLYLGGNDFSGSVPQGIVDNTQVTDLDLGDNPWLSGTLPNLQ